MALSAFGDPIEDDEPAQPVPQVQAKAVSAFGDDLDDVEPQPSPNRTAGQWVTDIGGSVGRGAYNLFDSIAGLGDIATGGAATPWLAAHGMDSKEARARLDAEMSPQARAQQQDVANANGFFPTMGAMLRNPVYTAGQVIESVPSMVVGGVAGRGAALGAKALGAVPRVAGVVGAGVGEGLATAGQQASQTVQQTGDLTAGQTGLALLSGGLTGLLGSAAARIGRKLGVADIDAQMAGSNAVDVAKGLVNRALTGTGIESLEELSQSGQQQVLTNLATDRPVLEGVDKQAAMGSVLGAAMGGAAGLRRPNTISQPQPVPMPAQQQQGMPPQQSASMPMSAPAPAASASPVAPQALAAQDYQPQLSSWTQVQQLTADRSVPQSFAGSQDINPLLDNLGVQGEQRTQSLNLLRPAEADIEARRRGVITLDEQRRLASLIGLEGSKANAFIHRKLGEAWNAETIIGATDLVSDRLQSVLAQQKHIASGNATDLERANFVDSYGELQSIFGELMGARAESGRALAAQRRKVQDVNQAKAILENLKGGQNADDLALALGEAVRVGGVANASKLMAKGPGFLNKWLGTYWRSALLTGAGTHAINATSNTGMLANEVIERGIASGIGGLKRAIGLKGETVFSEPMALLLGYTKNMTNAVGAAGQTWKTGQSDAINRSAEAYGGAFGQRPVELDDGTLTRPRMGNVDAAFDLPFRALGTSDAFFSTLNFAAEIEAQARQIAVSERRAGTLPPGVKLSQRIEQLVQTPTPAMLERADQHKLQQTFQTKGGPLLGLVMAAKARAPWLHAVAPFIQTPTNVV